MWRQKTKTKQNTHTLHPHQHRHRTCSPNNKQVKMQGATLLGEPSLIPGSSSHHRKVGRGTATNKPGRPALLPPLKPWLEFFSCFNVPKAREAYDRIEDNITSYLRNYFYICLVAFVLGCYYCPIMLILMPFISSIWLLLYWNDNGSGQIRLFGFNFSRTLLMVIALLLSACTMGLIIGFLFDQFRKVTMFSSASAILCMLHALFRSPTARHRESTRISGIQSSAHDSALDDPNRTIRATASSAPGAMSNKMRSVPKKD